MDTGALEFDIFVIRPQVMNTFAHALMVTIDLQRVTTKMVTNGCIIFR